MGHVQGFKVNQEAVARALALRALTARRWSDISGVDESTISRARHGRPVGERTLRKLTAALLSVPLLIGAELLIGPEEPK
jgi:hypothetical protein